MTFHLVCFGWLLFRAGSLEQVAVYLGIAERGVNNISQEVILAGSLLILSIGLHLGSSADRWHRAWLNRAPAIQGAAYAVAAVAIFLFSTRGERFIYFQF